MTYQHRFLMYAKAHGKRPEDITAGHHFINWIRQRWVQWDALVGHDGRSHGDADHAAFNAWLSEWVGALVDSDQQEVLDL